MEEALRESENQLRRQKRLLELSRVPVFMWEFDGLILDWNRGLRGAIRLYAPGGDRQAQGGAS
jgi:PAS domain-containing protein